VTPRPSARFASETEPEMASSPIAEVKGKNASAPPELIPVKASVFDDDFFQASSAREAMIAEEPTHYSTSSRVQKEESCSMTEEVFPVETSVRLPSFSGAMTAAVDTAVPDELDIPAFLRRGN
jgi:cell division protein FtsZ